MLTVDYSEEQVWKSVVETICSCVEGRVPRVECLTLRTTSLVEMRRLGQGAAT